MQTGVTENTPSKLKALVRDSGQEFTSCYQCLKCTSGCPAVEAGDYLPHRLVRRLQWGELDEVLEDSGLWSCLGCGTCGLRCPNDIAVDHLVDVLREWSLAEEAAEAANRTKQFHETFLSTIRSYGRIHELTLVARYKLRTRDWLSDMESGFSMFAKGKIPLMPSRVKALREVRRLFSEAEERGAEQGD